MMNRSIAFWQQALPIFAISQETQKFARKRVVVVNKYIVTIYLNEKEKDKLHIEYLFNIEYVPHAIIIRV